MSKTKKRLNFFNKYLMVILVIILFSAFYVHGQLNLNPSHDAKEIWVSVNGIEKSLQDALNDGSLKQRVTIKSTLPYSSIQRPKLSHGGNEVLVSINGIEINLQKAIDDGIIRQAITARSSGYSQLSLNFAERGNRILIYFDGIGKQLQTAIDEGLFASLFKATLEKPEGELLLSCLNNCVQQEQECKNRNSGNAWCAWFGWYCEDCSTPKLSCDSSCNLNYEQYSCSNNEECESNLCIDGFCRPKNYCETHYYSESSLAGGIPIKYFSEEASSNNVLNDRNYFPKMKERVRNQCLSSWTSSASGYLDIICNNFAVYNGQLGYGCRKEESLEKYSNINCVAISPLEQVPAPHAEPNGYFGQSWMSQADLSSLNMPLDCVFSGRYKLIGSDSSGIYKCGQKYANSDIALDICYYKTW